MEVESAPGRDVQVRPESRPFDTDPTWQDLEGPFNRAVDGLALVTLGTLQTFDGPWREVKNACSGSDVALAMSRIRSNRRQSRIFNSVQDPDGTPTATDEETIELIRRLHVLPVDLQLAYSATKNQAIAQCRRLLASGDAAEAEALWKGLINVATDMRLRKGTITIPDLWVLLRAQFELRHHPDFERDWETLSNITTDHKARIETELPSGYVVPRTAEKASFRTTGRRERRHRGRRRVRLWQIGLGQVGARC